MTAAAWSEAALTSKISLLWRLLDAVSILKSSYSLTIRNLMCDDSTSDEIVSLTERVNLNSLYFKMTPFHGIPNSWFHEGKRQKMGRRESPDKSMFLITRIHDIRCMSSFQFYRYFFCNSYFISLFMKQTCQNSFLPDRPAEKRMNLSLIQGFQKQNCATAAAAAALDPRNERTTLSDFVLLLPLPPLCKKKCKQKCGNVPERTKRTKLLISHEEMKERKNKTWKSGFLSNSSFSLESELKWASHNAPSCMTSPSMSTPSVDDVTLVSSVDHVAIPGVHYHRCPRDVVPNRKRKREESEANAGSTSVSLLGEEEVGVRKGVREGKRVRLLRWLGCLAELKDFKDRWKGKKKSFEPMLSHRDTSIVVCRGRLSRKGYCQVS